MDDAERHTVMRRASTEPRVVLVGGPYDETFKVVLCGPDEENTPDWETACLLLARGLLTSLHIIEDDDDAVIESMEPVLDFLGVTIDREGGDPDGTQA